MTVNHYQFVGEELTLRRDTELSLQEQILAFLRRSIVSGRIRRGSRMPSSRRLARELGASRTTLVEVYERLKAEGFVVARARAGLFAAQVLPEEYTIAPDARESRASLTGLAASHAPQGALPDAPMADPAAAEVQPHLPLKDGIPAIDHFPCRVWLKLASQVLRRHTAHALSSVDPRGEPALRRVVAEYLSAFRGIPCSGEQVIIASGSQPIVELLTRALMAPGDEVWFEEPGDPLSRAVLEALGLRVIPVPVDRHGLDVEAGWRLGPSARLAVVATSHQYPLTVTMSMKRRRALLDWAHMTDAWVLENEIEGDYRFAPQAREPLYTLDTGGRVIYLGSFNKAIAPGLRIGYAVLPRPVAAALPPIASTVSVQQQLLLAQFWQTGHLASHMRHLREVHARRRAVLLAALRQEAPDMLDRVEAPEAGLRVTLPLPAESSDVNLVEECRRAGISLGRPLSQCYGGAARSSGICIGFASTPAEQIAPAVRTLVQVLRSRGIVRRH